MQLDGLMQGCVQIWEVYRRPSDYPGGYVARLHVVGPVTGPTTIALYGETLSAVRRQLPPGLIQFTRHAEDEPHIVETWL